MRQRDSRRLYISDNPTTSLTRISLYPLAARAGGVQFNIAILQSLARIHAVILPRVANIDIASCDYTKVQNAGPSISSLMSALLACIWLCLLSSCQLSPTGFPGCQPTNLERPTGRYNVWWVVVYTFLPISYLILMALKLSETKF